MCKNKKHLRNKENHLEDSDIFATDLKTPHSDVEENPTARSYECEFCVFCSALGLETKYTSGGIDIWAGIQHRNKTVK